ncbi:hypothetical protein EDD15DRAFT_2197370 [Pisolithus albus]|nr:hypothetical protein EDD15DRAFT_2197370 [Pisolithus albus]
MAVIDSERVRCLATFTKSVLYCILGRLALCPVLLRAEFVTMTGRFKCGAGICDRAFESSRSVTLHRLSCLHYQAQSNKQRGKRERRQPSLTTSSPSKNACQEDHILRCSDTTGSSSDTHSPFTPGVLQANIIEVIPELATE